MNCAEKIEAIFDGKMVDRVPFALKGWRIPKGEMEDILLKEGMCIIDYAGVYGSTSTGIETESQTFEKNGATYHRTIIKTPKGTLSSSTKQVPSPKTESTAWREEMMFKSPEDYDAIEFMIRSRKYYPDYEPFLKAQEKSNGISFFKTGAPGSPIHSIMYEIMGLENFSIEWAERRDRVIALHDAIADNQREIFSIVAKSPAKVVQCGGNYSPEVLGKERFMDYIMPHWEESASILHEGGKMLGCHLDANNKLWAKEVGESGLDWIEAFTPSPDTDMTVAEARKIWAGKVFFINFPSSVHIQSAKVIEETTKQILRESAPGDRFIIGITENVPENRWRESFYTILKTVNKYGDLPIKF
ncbi:MAG: uroporphyrinogen decarboxylase family protein [Candidatus Poribacteria bacterium]